MPTYFLVDVVCAELDSGVRDNSNTIGSVASHETPPTFVPPHLGQSLWNRHFVFVATDALDLEKNLEALEGRYDGSRDSARHAAGDERSNDGLLVEFTEAVYAIVDNDGLDMEDQQRLKYQDPNNAGSDDRVS